MSDETVKAVADLFLNFGRVTVRKLEPQSDIPTEAGVLQVPCCRGVFPLASSTLGVESETMSVYTAKNFHKIFNFIRAHPAWGSDAADKRLPPAVVLGPSGCGTQFNNAMTSMVIFGILFIFLLFTMQI